MRATHSDTSSRGFKVRSPVDFGSPIRPVAPAPKLPDLVDRKVLAEFAETIINEAHKVAAAFYVEQLATPEAQIGRDFMTGRGFDAEAARHFGVGFAPKGWDALTNHLRKKGFSDAELLAEHFLQQMNAEGGTAKRFMPQG